MDLRTKNILRSKAYKIGRPWLVYEPEDRETERESESLVRLQLRSNAALI